MSEFGFTDVVGFTPPTDNAVLLSSAENRVEDNFFFDETGWLDVRAYQSLIYSHTFSGGTWVPNDYIEVGIQYAMDAAGTEIVYESRYELLDGSWRVIDVVHGNYVNIYVDDFDSVGNSTLYTYQLYGSYRPVAAPWLGDLGNLVLYSDVAVNLAAGGNIENPTKRPELGVGRAMMSVLSGAAGVARMRLTYGANANSIYDEVATTAANQRAYREIILPRVQPLARFFNDAAGIQTVRGNVIMQVYPQ